MSKRKFDLSRELESVSAKKRFQPQEGKKHSLDSDEEDEVKDRGVLHADDIEGEEDGVSRQEEGNRMTAFNMKEELEEGHFDRQGHFIWKNDKEIRDNWLDNIDWHNIKGDPNSQYDLTEKTAGLGDESDSSSDNENEKFDEIKSYKEMLIMMKPGESVTKALNRLGGGNKKLSSVERLRMKKAGTLVENEGVTKLTTLANNILTASGNMDIYQETYEVISKKIEKKIKPLESEQDMFADDFVSKADSNTQQASSSSIDEHGNNVNVGNVEVMWEFKWEQNDKMIHGPHSSSQMLQWVKDGYFKNGVFVRKHGDISNFYTSNRIDFDLYI